MHISYGNMWGSLISVHVWMVATCGDGHVLVLHARARGCVVWRVTEHESQCMFTRPLLLAQAALPGRLAAPLLPPAARNYFLAAGSLRQHDGVGQEQLGVGVEQRRRQ